MSWNLSIPWKNHLDAPHNSLVSSLWVFPSKLSCLHWSHCNRHIIKRWDHTIDVQYNALVGYTHPPIPIINFILIFVDLGLRSRTLAKESLPLIRSGMLSFYLSPSSLPESPSLYYFIDGLDFRPRYIGGWALRHGDAGSWPIRPLSGNQSAIESSC